MVLLLIWLVFGGLIVGGLGRLLAPGPHPIGLIRTLLVGWAGSFLGLAVSWYVLGLHYGYSLLVGFVLAVIFATIIVAAIDRRPPRQRSGGG
jgi:uncharacterized membrane protein YeaQ/YmgE (transglycosylase-associated protein family)